MAAKKKTPPESAPPHALSYQCVEPRFLIGLEIIVGALLNRLCDPGMGLVSGCVVLRGKV
jgi:hypothetical protein